MDNWLVYLLRSEKDGSLYCGSTNDVEKRLVAHNAGKGGSFTRSRRPWVVAMTIPCESKSDALKLEYKIKQMKREEKLKMIEDESSGYKGGNT